MPSLKYSLHASAMPKNLMKSAPKNFSKEQILCMRQKKEMMQNPDVTLSDSVKAMAKKMILSV